MQEIMVKALPPMSHHNGPIRGKHKIMFEAVAAVAIPDMGMKRVVDDEIVVHVTAVALRALPSIVVENCRLAGVKEGRRGIHGNAVLNLTAVRHAVIAIASPCVESAVIAGFQYGIEDVAALNPMSAEASVADVDSGAGAVADAAVGNRDSR